jgi:hypothetical protein
MSPGQSPGLSHAGCQRLEFAGVRQRTGKASKLASDTDINDLYDQLDNLRAYLRELSADLGKNAGRQFGRASAYASNTVREAEEAMKDNLAVSLVVAVGLGLVLGYLIRGGSERLRGA